MAVILLASRLCLYSFYNQSDKTPEWTDGLSMKEGEGLNARIKHVQITLKIRFCMIYCNLNKVCVKTKA